MFLKIYWNGFADVALFKSGLNQRLCQLLNA